MKFKILLSIIVILGSYQYYTTREYSVPNGVMVIEEPIQENVTPFIIDTINSFEIEAVAHFNIEARVLGVRGYYLGKEAEISPLDFALGWKEMSSNEWLEKITISQSNQFYFWKTRNEEIWKQKNKVIKNSANMHLIPKDKEIAKKLNKVRVGHIVQIEGYLVNAKESSFTWKTSLKRNDTGRGACEIIYVTNIEIIRVVE